MPARPGRGPRGRSWGVGCRWSSWLPHWGHRAARRSAPTSSSGAPLPVPASQPLKRVGNGHTSPDPRCWSRVTCCGLTTRWWRRETDSPDDPARLRGARSGELVPVAAVHLVGHLGQLGVGARRGAPQDLEGLLVADRVRGHEQAHGLPDLAVAGETLAEVLGTRLLL